MSQAFPTFIYPLPRDNNQWFFYVGQWGGNEINFTSLEHYKLNGPDAPVLLSMCHYPDLVGKINLAEENPREKKYLYSLVYWWGLRWLVAIKNTAKKYILLRETIKLSQ